MFSLRLWFLFALCPLLVVTACFASRTCYAPGDAPAHAGKDICLQAHVYDVTEEADGTRYLDVCAPGAACEFTVMSIGEDRREVGPLDTLKGTDVRLRGVVHTVRGQSMILLSHARQFRDGPEKFRPNPELLSGFGAGAGGTAFRDPAMHGHKTKTASAFRGGRY